jgi:hypothetical protein
MVKSSTLRDIITSKDSADTFIEHSGTVHRFPQILLERLAESELFIGICK